MVTQMRCGELIQTLDETIWSAMGFRPSAEQLATLVGGNATAVMLRSAVKQGVIARERLLQSQMRQVSRAATALHFSPDVDSHDLILVRTRGLRIPRGVNCEHAR